MSDASTRAGAILTVDLDAIAANWRGLAAKVAPKAQAAAVVKADAYGLGATKVAPALAATGCRRFVVATLDEALALRPLLAGADILVLSGPLAGSEGDFANAQLIPVLNSMEQIGRWEAFARSRQTAQPCAIHVDTGMSRLGLTAKEAAAFGQQKDRLAALAPVWVMTHLACADEASHPLNRRQLDLFGAARAHFPGIPGSMAASSGIFLGPDYHQDWVRPGAALYGVNPFPDQANPMAQVVCLQGKILQVRDVDAGDTVGYGATHRCQGAGRIAVVAAGYADGLFRRLGNRASGFLGNWRIPLVGRVSMDLITFDVSEVPETVAHPGAVIDLLSDRQTVDDLAQSAETIGYEILTALGRRYCRTYRGGSEPAQ